jgi:hypothetical protein
MQGPRFARKKKARWRSLVAGGAVFVGLVALALWWRRHKNAGEAPTAPL